MNAIGYIRRSKRSESKTVSLEEQTARVTEYCQQHDMTLAAVIRHDGVTGTHKRRRFRFDALDMALVNANAKAVVVYNLDRFARDAEGLLVYFRHLTERGIEIHETMTGKINFQDPLSKFTTGTRALVDELYAAVIGQKTAGVLSHLRTQGKRYSHIPPFGYTYQDGLMVANPVEQNALPVIRALHAQGYSYSRIQAALATEGYTGRMSRSTLVRLVRHKDP